MKRPRKLLFLVVILMMCLLLTSCSQNSENVTSNGKIAGTVSAAHEYTSEDYGFSFQYDNLTLNTKINGDQFAELTAATGDTATVKIDEADQKYGENPEEWLTKTDNTLNYSNYETKQLKLGKYDARLEEYSWKVGGKPLQTIVLTAYKDGLFYKLIVIMKEENVETCKPEFDIVVNSFTLSDKVIDLAALQPWKTQLPPDYPLDVINLYGIEKIYSVVGDKLEPGKGFISVQYYVKDDYSAEQIAQMFKDALQDSQDFKFTDSSSVTKLTGIKAGYEYEVQIKKYASGRINLVKVEVSKTK